MILPALCTRSRARPLALLLANGLAQAAAAVAKVLLLRHIFDLLVAVSQGNRGASVSAVGLSLAGLAMASGWLRWRESFDAERLGQSYVHHVRLALFDRLHSITPRTVNGLSRGGLLLRFVGDLSALRQWVSVGLARSFVAGAMALGTIVALSLLDPALAGAVLAVLVVGTALGLRSGRTFRGAVRQARRQRARLATTVHERLGALATTLAFGRVGRERQRLARRSRLLRDAMVERARSSGSLAGLSEATAALAVAVVLVVGAQRVAGGHSTPGTVVAALIVARMLIAPLHRLGRAYQLWQAAGVARLKLEEFLTLPGELVETADAAALARGPGCLELLAQGIDRELHPLSAVAAPGSVVAIVGPNGAGKSTLLGAIAGYARPGVGQILLDGHDLALVSSVSRRRAIGMMGPDLPLLRGTIESNLRYRCPEATDAELERVVRICGVDEVVSTLPRGLQSRVTEGGSNLAVGHRARIALARALMGQPSLLLLDEPEANLDAASRVRLELAVAGFPGTVLWVTHRPETTCRANAVWRLEAGRVAEVRVGRRRDARPAPGAPVLPVLLRRHGATGVGG